MPFVETRKNNAYWLVKLNDPICSLFYTYSHVSNTIV